MLPKSPVREKQIRDVKFCLRNKRVPYLQDWKTKLESIVGEGLKKIRRSGKEKKAMMKYLPGQASQGARAERALEEARAAVVRDWKNEFGRSLAVVFRRLEKLNADSNRRAGGSGWFEFKCYFLKNVGIIGMGI